MSIQVPDVATDKAATRRRFNPKIILRSKLAIVGIALLVLVLAIVLVGAFLWGDSPNATYVENAAPSLSHPAGTDFLGHDLFSQIAWGAFPSMFIAVGAAFGAIAIGTIAGVFAGYYTKMEALLGGIGDVILAFPGLLLLVVIGSLFFPSNLLIISILILVMWPHSARSIRAQVASVKKMAFIEAAKGSGLSDTQIIFREIIPEIGAISVAFFVLDVAIATVLTTALEFLGIGNTFQVSWGTIILFAQQYAFYLGDWWWIIFPGLIITLTASGFAFLGYTLEEIMNPRLRGSR